MLTDPKRRTAATGGKGRRKHSDDKGLRHRIAARVARSRQG